MSATAPPDELEPDDSDDEALRRIQELLAQRDPPTDQGSL